MKKSFAASVSPFCTNAANKPLSHYDTRFLQSETGKAVLHSLAAHGVKLDAAKWKEQLYIDQELHITDRAALEKEFWEEMKDPETREELAEMDIENFSDFLEYATDMGGDLHEIPYCWAVFCGGSVVGDLREDLEDACDYALYINKEEQESVQLVFCYC